MEAIAPWKNAGLTTARIHAQMGATNLNVGLDSDRLNWRVSLPRAGFKYRAALFAENLALWLAHLFLSSLHTCCYLPRPIGARANPA